MDILENKTEDLKFTVVIRTFDRPVFLRQAINSVLNQTYSNWEILIFDDGKNSETYEVYRDIKNEMPDRRIIYICSGTPMYFFKSSWFYMSDMSTGDILVKLDDDDILHPDALKYLNVIYSDHPTLDFTLGSCANFNDNMEVGDYHYVQNIKDLPKTTTAWLPYTIENNHPWKEPWDFRENFYEEPQEISSIIHAAKAAITTVYALYTVKKSSLNRVRDSFTLTSCIFDFDDLEFFGSLEYLGLSYTNLKKALIFVREHSMGRISDNEDRTKDSHEIKDLVDHLRPNDFKSLAFSLDERYSDWEDHESLKESFKTAISNPLFKEGDIKAWINSDRLYLFFSKPIGKINIKLKADLDYIYINNNVNIKSTSINYWFKPDNSLFNYNRLTLELEKDGITIYKTTLNSTEETNYNLNINSYEKNSILFKDKVISVVGSGEMHVDYSKEIDDSDIVIRFNIGALKYLDHPHLGKRLDIYASNGYFDKNTDAVIDFINRFKLENNKRVMLTHPIKKGLNHSMYTDDTYLKALNNNIEIIEIDKDFYIKNRIGDFYNYSSGIATLMFLSQFEFKEIKVFGFDGFKSGHFYEVGKDVNGGHSSDIESKILNNLAKNNKIIIF